MFFKIIAFLLFLTVQLLFTWYGYHTGKMATQGSFLGFQYDSVFVNALVTQIKFIWLLILANFIFSLAFHFGFEGYKSFLVVATIWIGTGPLAALLFNVVVVKEQVDAPTVLGISLVIIGGILVIAHKEILTLISS